MFKSCFHFNRFEIKREGARARLLLSGNGKKGTGESLKERLSFRSRFPDKKKKNSPLLLACSFARFLSREPDCKVKLCNYNEKGLFELLCL